MPGQVPDQVAGRLLAPAGRDDAARGYLVEQRHRAGLGVKQPPGPLVLRRHAPTIGQFAIPEQMITPGE
jgi:hypothetical protein